MTAIFRAALVAAFTAASIPTVAAGQDTSTASLLRRLELLERANTDLERRVVSWNPSSRVCHRKANLFRRRPNGGIWRTGVDWSSV